MTTTGEISSAIGPPISNLTKTNAIVIHILYLESHQKYNCSAVVLRAEKAQRCSLHGNPEHCHPHRGPHWHHCDCPHGTG